MLLGTNFSNENKIFTVVVNYETVKVITIKNDTDLSKECMYFQFYKKLCSISFLLYRSIEYCKL